VVEIADAAAVGDHLLLAACSLGLDHPTHPWRQQPEIERGHIRENISLDRNVIGCTRKYLEHTVLLRIVKIICSASIRIMSISL
jgi:hypothetical protein